MKNVFQKFLAILLLVLISFSSTLEVFAQNNFVNFSESLNISEKISDLQSKKEYQTEEEMKRDYDIISEMNTPYGKMYYMKKKWEVSTRATFWDVVDIGMAISSWAKLFGEPNWENAWWAVLDTASLLPIIPSLRHVKNVEEATKKISEFAKKSEGNRKRIINAFRTGRESIEKIFKGIYLTKWMRFAPIYVKYSQLEKKIYHASDLGLNIPKKLDGIKQPQKNLMIMTYRDEVMRILKNRQAIYMSSVNWMPSYAFVLWTKVIHVRRDNFEFLSGFTMNPIQLSNTVKSIEVKPLNFIQILFER